MYLKKQEYKTTNQDGARIVEYNNGGAIFIDAIDRRQGSIPMNILERFVPAMSHKDVEDRHVNVSDRFINLSTRELTEHMTNAGYRVVRAEQQGSFDAAQRKFKMHQLYFRPQRGLESHRTIEVGDLQTEIVVSNANDGSRAWRLDMGVHRFICANGAVVRSGAIADFRVPHIGRDTPNLVLKSASEIVDRVPLVEADIRKMHDRKLSEAEKRKLAADALRLRYPGHEDLSGVFHQRVFDANITTLLEARRQSDIGDNLWAVFNRLQENCIKGGGRIHSLKGEKYTAQRVRGLRNIVVSRDLNVKLWSAASGLL